MRTIVFICLAVFIITLFVMCWFYHKFLSTPISKPDKEAKYSKILDKFPYILVSEFLLSALIIGSYALLG